MSDMTITVLEDIGAVLRRMAKDRKVSITALTGNTGSSLQGLASGARQNGDANITPILRVFQKCRWEMVMRPERGDSVTIKRPNSLPLQVRGADGGPLELKFSTMPELAQALNTVAMANDKTLSRLVKETGSNITSVVTFATGTTPDSGLRLSSLLRILKAADFILCARSQFRNSRDARLHAEVSKLLPSK